MKCKGAAAWTCCLSYNVYSCLILSCGKFVSRTNVNSEEEKCEPELKIVDDGSEVESTKNLYIKIKNINCGLFVMGQSLGSASASAVFSWSRFVAARFVDGKSSSCSADACRCWCCWTSAASRTASAGRCMTWPEASLCHQPARRWWCCFRFSDPSCDSPAR